MGAGPIVAAGRKQEVLDRLLQLGAGAVIRLDQPEEALVAAFASEAGDRGYDVVVDYLWAAQPRSS